MTFQTTRRAPRPRIRLIAAACLSMAALFSSATATTAADLSLEQPWICATPDGAKVAGGFVVIRNAGSEPDRLVGGSAPFSKSVEIHEMAMEGDVMKMRALPDGLDIPAGDAVVLKPGSYHVMFMGLTQPLAEGETVAGTLMFEKAGTVDVEWAVEALGAKEPSHSGHKH
ncbi:copper chaperone PCu(A)C [Mongoliimonas terrestris]|uniref:copper chaperone PCu(A)C n=1 Tax=Mongoliimonas terrestris TaxID=1709001 RepID=UPI000949B0B8|nr:copper chaperone PCu(A)C [Mongoliimonas terrestris]